MIENPNAIDLVTRTKEGTILLIMIEDRGWDGSDVRLRELQEKLNAYLAFALDGELLERFPEAKGKPVAIQLDYVFPPDDTVIAFLERAEAALARHDVALRLNQLPP